MIMIYYLKFNEIFFFNIIFISISIHQNTDSSFRRKQNIKKKNSENFLTKNEYNVIDVVLTAWFSRGSAYIHDAIAGR